MTKDIQAVILSYRNNAKRCAEILFARFNIMPKDAICENCISQNGNDGRAIYCGRSNSWKNKDHYCKSFEYIEGK